MSFQKGDVVVIREEWSVSGHSDCQYLIVEWNGDRGYVSLVVVEGCLIVPQELVREFMIKKI